jgi:hypothetical protein
VRPKRALTVLQAVALSVAAHGTSDGWAGDSFRLAPRRLFAAVAGRRSRIAGVTVREAVYDGVFDSPKTAAGLREIPLSDAAMRCIDE